MGYQQNEAMLFKGIGRGGLDGFDEPLFQRQNFFKLKITPNLIALELSATCPLALLCTTLEGHITLMHHMINCAHDAWLNWQKTVQWHVTRQELLNLSGCDMHVSD